MTPQTTAITLTAAQWDSFFPFASTPQQLLWAEEYQSQAIASYMASSSWKTLITLHLFPKELEWVKEMFDTINRFQNYQPWLVADWNNALTPPEFV
jgi:hypothetical protein